MKKLRRLGILTACVAGLAALSARGAAQTSVADGVDLATFPEGPHFSAQPTIYPYTARTIGPEIYVRVRVLIMKDDGTGVAIAGIAAIRCDDHTARYGLDPDPNTPATRRTFNDAMQLAPNIGNLISDPTGGLHDRSAPLARELIGQFCKAP